MVKSNWTEESDKASLKLLNLMDEEVSHGEDEEVCSKQREQQVQRPSSRKELGMFEKHVLN